MKRTKTKPVKHVLTLLRRKLEMGQKQFAPLCRCSIATIQSIETGRLQLSKSLAEKIAFETGVHVGWLMDNNPAAPMLNDEGVEFLYQDFEKYRANISKGAIAYERDVPGTISFLME